MKSSSRRITVRDKAIGMLSALIVMLAVFAPVSASAAETYVLDPDHTYILFRVKHLGVGYSYGQFSGATGSFRLEDTPGAKSLIEIEAQAKLINTGVQIRDNHIRSQDFLNVENYPIISFRSTSVEKVEQDLYRISGDLMLLGKTRPITVKARQTGAGKDPWGKYRKGFETSFTIKRSDFGMDFMLGGVSDEVDLTVSVEGILQ